MDEYPRVHIEFKEGEDKIVVEGPPEEANQAKQQLTAMAQELVNDNDDKKYSLEICHVIVKYNIFSKQE